MDQAWKNRLLTEVRKRMKTFEVPGCRQSRRIEGMFTRDEEVHGFMNLCIYIDTALAGREEVVSEILGSIDSFIYGKEHYNHNRWLMFFGSDSERLVAPRPSSVHGAIRSADWKGIVTKCISDNPATGEALIPRLHNPGSGNTRFPDRKDLALFFCSGRNICVSEEQQKSFVAIRQRSIWFFLGDKELPEMDAGGFVPREI